MLFLVVSQGSALPPTKGGGTSPDSLVIVRVVRPADELVRTAPVMYVSRGKGKIEKVEMTDLKGTDAGQAIKNTLNALVVGGYVLESATESNDHGIKLSSFYFKKRVV
jgi:hypothetical protein